MKSFQSVNGYVDPIITFHYYHSMAIIDGKAIAKEILSEIKQEIESLRNRPPCLAVILVGEHPPSHVYVNRKTKTCDEVGIRSILRRLPANISEDALLKEIELLNADSQVDGILVQLPLPNHIEGGRVLRWIAPEKDVDGFHPINVGKMLIGEEDGFVPCTPLGIKEMLLRSQINVSGKHVVIVGRSNIVGKPLAALFVQKGKGSDATVTVAHRMSSDLKAICLTADVLIVAIGIPHFIKEDMIREGTVVIDVGINRIEDATKKNGTRLVGDVDFDRVQTKCSFITPVPGGVGPMTIAMLLKNTLKSYHHQIDLP